MPPAAAEGAVRRPRHSRAPTVARRRRLAIILVLSRARLPGSPGARAPRRATLRVQAAADVTIVDAYRYAFYKASLLALGAIRVHMGHMVTTMWTTM